MGTVFISPDWAKCVRRADAALEGKIHREAMRKVAVLGTQYFWDQQTLKQSASLLWRTIEDATPATQWSGSVL